MGRKIEIILWSVSVLVVLAVLAVCAVPLCAGPREKARQANCMSNVKQISLAMLMYTQDYDEKFPPPAKWNQVLLPYMRNDKLYFCPEEKNQKVPSYAMNKNLKSADPQRMKNPSKVVGIYESKPGKNRAGGKELLPASPRHENGYIIGFADGHVKFYQKSQLSELVWKP